MEPNDKSEEEDEAFELAPDTVAALNEFLMEQRNLQKHDVITEDWQLSQFWYSEETCRQIVEESLQATGGRGTIACVCCPSLIPFFNGRQEVSGGEVECRLFEFDTRFMAKYPEQFTFYNYNDPINIPCEFYSYFDFLIVDPPFLSDECFVKIAQTIRLLSKQECSKLLVNTGSVMEDLLKRLLNLQRTSFKPVHKNNLANDFSSFSNYKLTTI